MDSLGNEILKPTELRIGNLVLAKGSTTEVFGLDEEGVNGITDRYDTMEVRYTKVQGIPLTEEWLIRLGFEEDDQHWGRAFPIDGGHTGYSIMPYGDKWGFAYSDELTKETYIEYVHQLQNLFFALTGKELEVKESARP